MRGEAAWEPRELTSIIILMSAASEAHMATRLSRLLWLPFLILLLLLGTAVHAKDKSKAPLPEVVLRAQTVRVMIDPGAGEPLDHPTANATARDNVEKALLQWGRLHPVMDGQEADLVISVRTGSRGVPTVRGGPVDQRPGVAQPIDGGIRIGVQQGHPPNSDPTMPGPLDNGPHIGREGGSPEDAFEVYLGNVQSPLDSAPIWRYMAKDCLRAPDVTAVEQFRKAIVESEKQQQKKKP
jgi:hypothetical protein